MKTWLVVAISLISLPALSQEDISWKSGVLGGLASGNYLDEFGWNIRYSGVSLTAFAGPHYSAGNILVGAELMASTHLMHEDFAWGTDTSLLFLELSLSRPDWG